MSRSSPDFFSNPTIRRLTWIKTLFSVQTSRAMSVTTHGRIVDSIDSVPKPGVLLVAPPMMHDPNFRRTVVYLCEHTPEGSFGLILNRPLGLRLEALVQNFEGHDVSIGKGGPVQTDTLHFIHTCGDAVPNGILIDNGIYWGGEFEVVKSMIEAGQATSEDVRFFLGYAGWSPGQLADEIELGGWIIAPGVEQDIFGTDPDAIWRNVLRRKGGEYAVLSNFPEDPRLN